MLRLAEHPRIVAIKDAKGDLGAASTVIAGTDLAYYSGDDMLNLPLLSVGAAGVVSVVRARRATPRIVELVTALPVPATSRAPATSTMSCCPSFTGIFRTQGVILTKAALNQLGLPAGTRPAPAPRRHRRPGRASCAATSPPAGSRGFAA